MRWLLKCIALVIQRQKSRSWIHRIPDTTNSVLEQPNYFPGGLWDNTGLNKGQLFLRDTGLKAQGKIPVRYKTTLFNAVQSDQIDQNPQRSKSIILSTLVSGFTTPSRNSPGLRGSSKGNESMRPCRSNEGSWCMIFGLLFFPLLLFYSKCRGINTFQEIEVNKLSFLPEKIYTCRQVTGVRTFQLLSKNKGIL